MEKPPEKTSNTYKVLQNLASESILSPIVDEVLQLGKNTPKKIFFCRSYKDLVEIYTHMVTELFNRNVLNVELDGKLVALSPTFSASTE